MTLRFVLDHNIDVAAAKVLRDRGWWAHTLNELGNFDVSDETVAIVAHERDAVAVTADVEFTAWRRRRLVGKHVFMRCPDHEVAEVIDRHIDDAVGALEHNAHILVRISRDNVTMYYAWDA